MYSDGVTIIKIGGLINEGGRLTRTSSTTEQIQAAKETMIQAKPKIRNFWSSQNDTINDFVNGNVWRRTPGPTATTRSRTTRR